MRITKFLAVIALMIFHNLGAQNLSQKIDDRPIRATIDQISAKEVIFQANGLVKGMSGVVLTKNNDNEIIIANLVVQSVDAQNVRARFWDFKGLDQKFLPTPLQKPKVGDIVLFRSFYNRAFVIAPVLDSYSRIIRQNENLEILHIDLFAAFMQQESLNAPNTKTFSKFCNTFSIGLVLVLNSKGVNVMDCQSFQRVGLQSLDFEVAKKPILPFFSRITENSKGKLGSKFKKKVKDYWKYYDDLIF